MQRFVGLVVGTASRKTAKVCVERLFTHPRYHVVCSGGAQDGLATHSSQSLV